MFTLTLSSKLDWLVTDQSLSPRSKGVFSGEDLDPLQEANLLSVEREHEGKHCEVKGQKRQAKREGYPSLLVGHTTYSPTYRPIDCL